MASLPETFEGPLRIAIIGGTGLTSLPSFTPIATLPLTHPALQTPWGSPSSPITILSHPRTAPTNPLSTNTSSAHPSSSSPPLNVAFLSRHGLSHEYAPHEVPSRANIAALRKLGVRCIVAFSAVGSLQEAVRPRDFLLPDQVIDRTKGVRPWTFFESGIVSHVPFADPFDPALHRLVAQTLASSPSVLSPTPSSSTPTSASTTPSSPLEAPKVHPQGLLVCMEGPQFSTRAESQLYRAWGGAVINMSCLPEAKLAREAEMGYVMVCMATDYDCWREGEGDVSVEMVMGHMAANAGNARRVAGAVLDVLGRGVEGVGGAEGEEVERIRRIVNGDRWRGQSLAGLSGMSKDPVVREEVKGRIGWLFEDFKG